MWSNLYWYYSIRKDDKYSEYLPISVMLTALKSTGKLVHTGPQSFANGEDFPWIVINCVYSKNGSFSNSKSDSNEIVNLISIVASKQNPHDENSYIDFLTEVANSLKWELILEENDEGDEDVLLNKTS